MTIDTKKIATLARAGLTDEQIEQVCKMFAGATGAPTVEATPTVEPTPTVEVAPATPATEGDQHPHDTRYERNRNRNARALVLALVARGPCKIADIARHVYGDDNIRSLKCADRMVDHLRDDALVTKANDIVSLALGSGSVPARAAVEPVQVELKMPQPMPSSSSDRKLPRRQRTAGAADRAMRELASGPKTVTELAEAIYGDGEPRSRERVKRVVDRLRTWGKAVRRADGRVEAVTTKAVSESFAGPGSFCTRATTLLSKGALRVEDLALKVYGSSDEIALRRARGLTRFLVNAGAAVILPDGQIAAKSA